MEARSAKLAPPDAAELQPDEFEDEDELAVAEAAAPAGVVHWRPTFRESLADAWDSRHVLRGLASQAIPRYQGYYLGRFWLFGRPALQLFGFGLLFGGIFHTKAPNGVPYMLFLVFSMMGWHAFLMTFRFQGRGLQLSSSMLRGMKLPLMLVPVIGPVRALFHIMVYAIFGAGFLIYYLFTKGHFYLQLPPQFLFGLAGVALCLAYGWSLGIPLGLIYPKAKEIKFVIRYATTLWLFVTPVLYPLEMLHGWAHTVAQLNPLTGAVELVQSGFLDAGKVHMLSILVSLIGLVLLTLFGLWVFNRYAVKMLAMPDGGRDNEEDDEGEML